MADNIIKVNVTSNKQQRVTVSSAQVGTEITASSDTGKFWAQSAKNWAVSDFIVDNTDYSSKYYANVSKQKAQNSQTYAEAAQNTYNAFQLQSGEAIEELQTTKTSSIEEITTTKDTAIDSINSTKTTILNDIEFVAEGEKEEIKDLADLIKENAEEIASRTSFAMFDTILKDHILTYEESKGLALQGTYVYKEAIAGSRYGYPDFYNKVVEEYNEASQEEIVNGVTIKVHSNGHKFYNIADKTAIDEFFNTMGLAWFYGVDIENERIFLPRNNYFEQATGDIAEVGLSVEAGLPDHDHTVTFKAGISDQGGYTGVDCTTAIGSTITGTSSKASLSNSIYGNSETVQPNAVKKLLYICVGNTTNYEGVTNVINQGMEILEQVNQGIETRIKLDGSNAQFPYIIETFSEGTSWYRVWSDGWCEQGGRAYEEASIVTLLKPYKDANYNVVCNSLQTNSNTTNAINLKATQFEINTTSGSSSKVALWQACGYIV